MKQTVQVAILMATYNGARYLPTQLDSILNQDFEDWQLLISDDGSTDGTLDILADYQKRYPEKIRILEKETPTGSAKKNFMFLTRQADNFPYVMYCDQDDFWQPEKVRVTLKKMKETESGDTTIPCLVHTDLEVVDQNLITISKSFFQFSGLNASRCALNQLLIQNIVTGCTMMINHALWKFAMRPADEERILMHDWWFALIAAAIGRIGFVDQPLIRYRQHGDNSVGAKEAKDPAYISSQIKKGKGNRVAMENTMRQAGGLIGVFADRLDVNIQKLLKEYASLVEQSKGKRIRTVCKYRIWKNGALRKAAELFYL